MEEEQKRPEPAIACTPCKIADEQYHISDTDGYDVVGSTPDEARANLVAARGNRAVHFLGYDN